MQLTRRRDEWEFMRLAQGAVLFILILLAPGASMAASVHAVHSDSLTVAAAATGKARVAARPAARTGSAPAADLAPSTAPPWNPPRAVPRRETWERVILFPQRVATLPLTGLGIVADRAFLWLENTPIGQQMIAPAPHTATTAGITIGTAKLGDRTGLGARLGARTSLLSGMPMFKSTLSASHAATLHHYHDTQFGIRGMLGATEYQNQWRPQDQFYGLGMGSSQSGRTDYASQFEQVRISFGYAWNEVEGGGDPRTEFALWVGPRGLVTRSGREAGTRSIEEVFPGVVDPTLDHRILHLLYGVRMASDWRVGQPHWSDGWRVLFESQRYDAARGLIRFGMRGEPGAQFTRTRAEMETGFSFMRDPRTFRILGRMIDTGVSSGRDRMQVIDLPTLGGREGLAGFEPGRFHDLDLLLARLTYVFPLVRKFEMDLHVESGTVNGDLWRATRLDGFRQSFGFALRARGTTRPFGSIGLDFSDEGTRIRYTLGSSD